MLISININRSDKVS